VFSRHRKDWGDRVPAIVEAMLALPAATFDGEGVVCDDRCVPDFERCARWNPSRLRGFFRHRVSRTRDVLDALLKT
jgi:hypothetical protein